MIPPFRTTDRSVARVRLRKQVLHPASLCLLVLVLLASAQPGISVPVYPTGFHTAGHQAGAALPAAEVAVPDSLPPSSARPSQQAGAAWGGASVDRAGRSGGVGPAAGVPQHFHTPRLNLRL